MTVVESGWGALEATKYRKIDLSLLDVFLPFITVIELIPQLRAPQSETMIITITGQSSRDVERRLREFGISYYMAKPFQRYEFHSILVHMACRQRRSVSSLPDKSPNLFVKVFTIKADKFTT